MKALISIIKIRAEGRKAQSMVELAIFGTIIIFLFGVLIQYGMSFNLQQHLSMQTLRQSIRDARRTHQPESVTMIKDMPVPNPSNPFSLGETIPVAAGSQVSVSNMLQRFQFPVKEPKLKLIINGVEKEYTIASVEEYPIVDLHRKFNKKETAIDKLPFNYTTPVGPLWRWNETEVEDLEEGDMVDFDHDGKPEQIAYIRYEDDDPSKDMEKMWYFDYENGEIDTTIQPEDGTPHGLQEAYIKQVTTASALTTSPDGSSVSISGTEEIQRTIKTQSGDETVTSTITQEHSYDW